MRLLKENLFLQFSAITDSSGRLLSVITPGHKPDIILMDIMMPEKDGYTACGEITTNEATKAIPIVMLTGIGYELNKKLAESTGASGYITKPFKSQELIDMISKFL